jgi:hypothetical protein
VSPLRAAEPAAEADLLEYLGSVDSDEAGWHDYLAATDVEKLVKNSASAPAAPPPVKPTAPAATPSAPPVPPKVKPT